MYGDRQGVAVAIFDYGVKLRNRRNRSATTIARFQTRGVRLPYFRLQPEGIFDRAFAALGAQDIDFPAHPEFSRRYVLKGHHPAAVQHLFNAVIRSIETYDRICVEGADDQLIIYRFPREVRPHEIGGFFHEAFGIFAVFTGRGGTNAGRARFW